MTTDEQPVTCIDCGDVMPLAERRQHMADLHGVLHAPYESGPALCPKCGEAPCCRAERLLSGGGQ